MDGLLNVFINYLDAEYCGILLAILDNDTNVIAFPYEAAVSSTTECIAGL